MNPLSEQGKEGYLKIFMEDRTGFSVIKVLKIWVQHNWTVILLSFKLQPSPSTSSP